VPSSSSPVHPFVLLRVRTPERGAVHRRRGTGPTFDHPGARDRPPDPSTGPPCGGGRGGGNLRRSVVVGKGVRPRTGETTGDRRPGQYGQSRSEEHTSELQSRFELVCRLLLEQ